MTPMASDMPTSIEQLVEPIHHDAPAGGYLRYDSLYDKIAEARKEERELPQGVWQRATKRADWKAVEHLCTHALAEQTKDLQIAAWLTEAWLHLRGLPGLVAGLTLMDDLHQGFALTMHPAPEPGTPLSLPLSEADPSIEHRINIIQWLNEKLSIETKLLPLTCPADTGSVSAFSFADIESAQIEEQKNRRQTPTPNLQSQMYQFNRSITLTPVALLISVWKQIEDAQNAANSLEKTLDTCYGHANSGLGKLRQVLENMALAIGPAIPAAGRQSQLTHCRDVDAITEGVEDGRSPSLSPISVPELSPMAVEYHAPRQESGAIRTREDAYTRLYEIADYLAHLEPHSPVPYLLRRAIAWGGMSLHELLPEILQDQASLRNVGHLLHLDQLEH